jgi:hypothetical protein
MAGERGSRKMALQEKEFILGGQFNEDGTTRLEVALVASEGTTRLELRLLGWGEGIGWYIQKRIQLDRLQIRALKQILGRGTGRMASAAPKLKITYRADQQTRENPQDLSMSLCS